MRYITHFSHRKLVVFLSVFVLLFTSLVLPYAAYSIQLQALEEIVNDRPLYAPGVSCTPNPSSGLSSGSVYVMGDSITAGAQNTYETKFSEEGFTATINGLVSRRLVGTPPSPDGLGAITQDTAQIKDASVIVIALGTNGAFTPDQVNQTIDQLRAINPNAQIYWVDTAVVTSPSIQTPADLDAVRTANQVLYTKSTEKNFKVISWFKAVFGQDKDPQSPGNDLADVNGFISDGSVHPNQAGNEALVNLVLDAIKGNLTGKDLSNCVCPSTAALGAELDGHQLPASEGGTAREAPIDSTGKFLDGDLSERVAMRGLVPGVPEDKRDYYITMRWRYRLWNWNGTDVKGPEDSAWYFQEPAKKVLTTNPRTGKSIVSPILEAGPAPWTGTPYGPGSPPGYWNNPQDGTPPEYNGRVSGFGPKGFEALEAQTTVRGEGDRLIYSWADQNAEIGETTVASAGPPTTGAVDPNCGGLGGQQIENVNAYFQSDPEWRNHPYASTTLGPSGCGPTSLAVVLSTLLDNPAITPATMADEMAGYYVPGTGTSWGAFTDVPKKYGLGSRQTSSITEAMDAMKSGALVIVSLHAGLFTGGGHIMVLRGVTPDGKIKIIDVGESTANHPRTDTTYTPEVITENSMNGGTYWIITK